MSFGEALLILLYASAERPLPASALASVRWMIFDLSTRRSNTLRGSV